MHNVQVACPLRIYVTKLISKCLFVQSFMIITSSFRMSAGQDLFTVKLELLKEHTVHDLASAVLETGNAFVI